MTSAGGHRGCQNWLYWEGKAKWADKNLHWKWSRWTKSEKWKVCLYTLKIWFYKRDLWHFTNKQNLHINRFSRGRTKRCFYIFADKTTHAHYFFVFVCTVTVNTCLLRIFNHRETLHIYANHACRVWKQVRLSSATNLKKWTWTFYGTVNLVQILKL